MHVTLREELWNKEIIQAASGDEPVVNWIGKGLDNKKFIILI